MRQGNGRALCPRVTYWTNWKGQLEMLEEMIDRLIDAADRKEKERVLRRLERAGMDRASAMAVACERKKERGADEVQGRTD